MRSMSSHVKPRQAPLLPKSCSYSAGLSDGIRSTISREACTRAHCRVARKKKKKKEKKREEEEDIAPDLNGYEARAFVRGCSRAWIDEGIARHCSELARYRDIREGGED
jgi:hypothetical protein